MSLSTGLPDVFRSSRPAGEAGFTLVEVMVAFAIAAAALIVLARALGMGLTGTARVKSADAAVVLAQSALDPLGIVAPLKDGDRAQVERDGYHVSVAVDRYAGDNVPRAQGYLVLYRLTATVQWREGAQARSLSLTTLRLGPRG